MYLKKNVSFWKNVLLTDESKFNRFQFEGKLHITRPMKQENKPLYILKTVKHGVGNIKVWGAMYWHGIGLLFKIDGNLDQYNYKYVFKT